MSFGEREEGKEKIYAVPVVEPINNHNNNVVDGRPRGLSDIISIIGLLTIKRLYRRPMEIISERQRLKNSMGENKLGILNPHQHYDRKL